MDCNHQWTIVFQRFSWSIADWPDWNRTIALVYSELCSPTRISSLGWFSGNVREGYHYSLFLWYNIWWNVELSSRLEWVYSKFGLQFSCFIWEEFGYIAVCIRFWNSNIQGLVRAVGVSNYGPSQLVKIHDYLKARGVPLCSAQVINNWKMCICILNIVYWSQGF